MGTTWYQTVFLASSPFVGQVDTIVEHIVADFGVGFDKLNIDITIDVGKSTVDKEQVQWQRLDDMEPVIEICSFILS